MSVRSRSNDVSLKVGVFINTYLLKLHITNYIFLQNQ